MRRLRYMAFVVAAMSILLFLHVYYWARLVRDPAWPPLAIRIGTVLFAGLYVSMPIMFFSDRAGRIRALAWVGFVWMGMVVFLLLALVPLDLVRGVAIFAGWVPEPERRQWLARLVSVAAVGAAAVLAALAIRSARHPVALREVSIVLDRLPDALHGTTIVQLTDLHVGTMLGRTFVAEIVRRTNSLGADLIAITGDLVDGAVDDVRESVTPLRELKARHGVYFVTGNHEYYSGATAWIAELSRIGVRVLRNERVAIGEAGCSFDLAGIDDYHARSTLPDHGPDLPRALAGRDSRRALVLLAHQPRAIHEAARLGVGLQLSGHTHGGQIWPFSYLVRLQQPHVAGLTRVGKTFLYVSRGAGYWGPPMRLGIPAEITRIILRSPTQHGSA
jgi:uncharacterized protein